MAGLIIVRHGRTEANAGRRLLGRLDLPLDDLGRRQAQALGRAVGPVDRVVSSPLLRTRQTAECIDGPTTTDERFIELDYGAYDGMALSDVPAEMWTSWRHDPDYAPPGGESMSALQTRVSEGADRAGRAGPNRDDRRRRPRVAHQGRRHLDPRCRPRGRVAVVRDPGVDHEDRDQRRRSPDPALVQRGRPPRRTHLIRPGTPTAPGSSPRSRRSDALAGPSGASPSRGGAPRGPRPSHTERGGDRTNRGFGATAAGWVGLDASRAFPPTPVDQSYGRLGAGVEPYEPSGPCQRSDRPIRVVAPIPRIPTAKL